MKKIIGFLGVLVFAMATFFNINMMNNSVENLSLDVLRSVNVANAEEGSGTSDCSGSVCPKTGGIYVGTGYGGDGIAYCCTAQGNGKKKM